MTTGTKARSTRHHTTTFREDTHMFHVDLRLAEIHREQDRFRRIRHADRALDSSARSLRHQVGQSLVRLGRRIGGEAMTAPAWQG